jgi:hypothetical protein
LNFPLVERMLAVRAPVFGFGFSESSVDLKSR